MPVPDGAHAARAAGMGGRDGRVMIR
jgi:hypothetical protein